MELKLSQQTLTMNDVVYDGIAEQSVESDVLLPDHCPDIHRILKCDVTPSLLGNTVNADKLTIEGMAVVHVYYLSEDMCMRHTEYKIPYSRVVDLKSAPVSPIVNVTQSLSYINCRAVSSRRLDIRGAINIRIKVFSQNKEEVVCDADGMGVQLQRDVVHTTQICAQACRPFSVHEELDIGYGKAPVGTIVRYCANAQMTDYKVISGKVVAKGDLALHVLYQSEDNPRWLETMDYSLPISQIIDVDDTDEDSICEVRFEVCGVDLMAKQNMDGECRIIAMEVSLNASVTSIRNQEIGCASDCYSTDYECKHKNAQIKIMRMVDMVGENSMFKDSVALPAPMKGIADIWGQMGGRNVKLEDGFAIISAKLMVCLFAITQEDSFEYVEKSFEFSCKIQIKEFSPDILFDPAMTCLSTAYTMSGNDKLEVRCDIRIEGAVYQQNRRNMIADITVDESKRKQKENNKLYIYYAGKGESVWNIAKHYNTPASVIMEENSLGSDVLHEDNTLLIPIL